MHAVRIPIMYIPQKNGLIIWGFAQHQETMKIYEQILNGTIRNHRNVNVRKCGIPPQTKVIPYIKVWSGTVDLTEPDPPEPYELKCKWYNVQQYSNECPINFVEEKTKTCTITVIDWGCICDQLTDPGDNTIQSFATTITCTLPGCTESCKEYLIGHYTPNWEWVKLFSITGGCNEQIQVSTTLKYTETISGHIGITLYNILQAGLSFSVQWQQGLAGGSPCSKKTCKRRKGELYQKKLTTTWDGWMAVECDGEITQTIRLDDIDVYWLTDFEVICCKFVHYQCI